MIGSNSSCSTPAPTVLSSPIVGAIDWLMDTQATTHRLIDELEKRLDCVLTTPPNGVEANAGLGGASSLHFAVLERGAIAEAHNDKLRGLLGRLTV